MKSIATPPPASKVAPNLSSAALLEQIRFHLVKERARHKGGSLKLDDAGNIQEVVGAISALCALYREAVWDRAHSERIKGITEDLDSLKSLVKPWMGSVLSEKQQEKVRIRIKAFHSGSRDWIAVLPSSPGVKLLPDLNGVTAEARAMKLKDLWKTTEAAIFTPPPPHGAWLDEALTQLGPLIADYTGGVLPKAVELRTETLLSVWKCKPTELVELLDFAKEVLFLETGGPDRGGNTTLIQRRMRSSAKNSFALSCLLLYERAVGDGTGKQTNSTKRAGGASTPFERFCRLVLNLASEGKKGAVWVLGPDPVRKAIATNRAWRRLFQAAGCGSAEEFHALPENAQQEAVQELTATTRKKLTPSAPPWV